MSRATFHAQAQSMAAVVTICAAIQGAQAIPWAEVGDAGQLPSTAQFISVLAGPITSISGSTGPGDPVDAYLIWIITPATFSATTVGGADWDTQLFLFSTTGIGIATNDNAPGSLQSTLPQGHPLFSSLPIGIYMLAVSGGDAGPSSAAGLIFPGTTTGVLAATGPGGSMPLTGWSGSVNGGSYTIILTGVAIPPSPAGIGLLAVAAMTSRRRR